jgi:antitoxin ParD1/3/4
MATTSLSLGPYWEAFLKELVESGRYATQSEAIREALRGLEVRERKVQELREHLAEGEAQADRGEFVAATPESILGAARKRQA